MSLIFSVAVGYFVGRFAYELVFDWLKGKADKLGPG